MIKVHTDGGSRGNPGHAAYGFVIEVDGKVVKEDGGYIGIATNNFAEYTAVIKALGWLSSKYKGQDLHFFLDSELVMSQLSGVYKIKNAAIRDLVFKVKSLETEFGQIKYTYIPRSQNKEADRLVNLALDSHIE